MSQFPTEASAPPAFAPQNPTENLIAPPQYTEVAFNPSAYGAVQPNTYQQVPGYQQQYADYPQQPVYDTTQQPRVVQTQPGVPVWRAPKPSTHMALSVFSMICCCFLLGLIALIIGLDVESSYNNGDIARAKQKSKQALGLSIAAIGFGVVLHLAWIALAIWVIVVVARANTTT